MYEMGGLNRRGKNQCCWTDENEINESPELALCGLVLRTSFQPVGDDGFRVAGLLSQQRGKGPNRTGTRSTGGVLSMR